VNELVQVVDIGQPGVSRQLQILEDADFVVVRPEGRRRMYALRPDRFRELSEWVTGYRPSGRAGSTGWPPSSIAGEEENQVKGEKTMTTTAVTTQIRPCIVFSDGCEEAIKLYVSLFPNSKVVNLVISEAEAPIAKGKVLNAVFQLGRARIHGVRRRTDVLVRRGFSLMVTARRRRRSTGTEASSPPTARGRSVRLAEGQVRTLVADHPSALGQMLTDSKSGDSGRPCSRLLKMKKLDIAQLQHAYRGR